MGLWNPKVQCIFHKDYPMIPILSRISSIPCIRVYFFKIHPNIALPSRLENSRGLIPVGLPVKLLKALLASSITATWPTHLNSLYLITLTILGERYKLWSSPCGAFSTPHFHPSWAQIFASGSCFQIPLACIPPLM